MYWTLWLWSVFSHYNHAQVISAFDGALLNGCATVPLLLPSRDQFKGFVFNNCNDLRYSLSDILLLDQSPEMFSHLDLTTHIHHWFSTKQKSCIRPACLDVPKCTPPAIMLFPSLLNINIYPLITKLPDLFLSLRSRTHVLACVIRIQESWLNMYVADAPISILGFEVYWQDRQSKRKSELVVTSKSLLVMQVWTSSVISIFRYWLPSHSVSS